MHQKSFVKQNDYIPYVPLILGQLLDLIFLARTNFLGPDSNPMTHETWLSSASSMIGIEMRFKTFIKTKYEIKGIFHCVVLGILSK